jgi:hypothetical protein
MISIYNEYSVSMSPDVSLKRWFKAKTAKADDPDHLSPEIIAP